jgi:phosphotriesterase-related protein
VQTNHPPYVQSADVDDLQRRIENEFERGVIDGIRPGIVGEVGLTWPLHPEERKVLVASARASVTTGLPLSIHPGRDVAAPFEAIDIVHEAGGDVSRTVMCHVDRTLFTTRDVLRLADTGVRVAFDLFGAESAYYPAADIDMPNDGRRSDLICALVEHGNVRQIHVSHDIVLKTRLTKYGGEGYAHILERVTPILRRKGLSDDDLRTILVTNPAELLTNAHARQSVT